MLILQHISYTLPNKDLLFNNINLTVNNREKIALIGNNGAGKSTLLRIIAGELQPSGGQLRVDTPPYHLPQIFGQYNHLTIAQALKVEHRVNALKEILNGNATENNYALLNDDWTIEERCNEVLRHWQLSGLRLSQKMETLSGREVPCELMNILQLNTLCLSRHLLYIQTYNTRAVERFFGVFNS